MYRPHPDLPPILEEAATPGSTASSHMEDVEITPNENNIEEEGDIVDDSSNASSFAGSYAFTLDNVGFDEENSLVGSVVDNVVFGKNSGGLSSGGGGLGHSSDSIVVHTPPSQYSSPDRMSKHDRKLHRETCRSLGLPFSPETDSSSPSSGSETTNSLDQHSSVLGSISVSSGSGVGNSMDELDNREKTLSGSIDKLWPWPTKGSSKTKKAKEENTIEKSMDETVPLDENNVNASVTTNDGCSQKRSLITMAKLSDSISPYKNRFKDAIASFNERIEAAYERTKQQQNQASSSSDPEELESNTMGSTYQEKKNDNMSFANHYNKKKNLNTVHLVDAYKQADPRTKLKVGLSILLTLLCIIIILATVGLKDGGGDGDVLQSQQDDELSDLLQSIQDNDKSNSVSSSPGGPSGTSHGDVICIDNEGKFHNAQGKRRNCHWLSTQSSGALFTDKLDVECGAVGQVEPSELALNCQHTCRGYNGCPLSTQDLLQVEEEEGDESVSMVQSAPPESSELLAEATSVPTYIVTSSVPTISPTTGSPTNTAQPTAEPLPSFIDVRGRERQCWWLDIRNQNQKLIRREQNCVRVEVQDTCPSSCAAYITTQDQVINVDIVNGEAASIHDKVDGTQHTVYTVQGASDESSQQTFESETDSNADVDIQIVYDESTEEDESGNSVQGEVENGEVNMQPMSQASNIQQVMNSQASFAGSFAVGGSGSPQLMRTVDTQEEECSDQEGYYLNNFGFVEQCAWLINSRDPTDETRRMYNCGYPGNHEYSKGTDLGRMCKKACGTCGL